MSPRYRKIKLSSGTHAFAKVLSSKESAAQNLNEFKRILNKFDINIINFDSSIVAVIKHKDNSYEYY